ncbi:TetR family transcriptional regulator [Azoarcus olearius]|uniref:TetR/AcrR family transcriptional regulator n=1 Tax=Azoarcus sp. (strain BH72) TaxID=418699 RepID=UPI0008061757|nr:TetR/AcrR family transcriptional regulator [Azoarcus olearius]ANQ85663.1 TetR family transcriptional regulator [Azoarcus olearius]
MTKQEHLVDSAMQLFYRQGFHATGVDQLSKEGEVTKRTLYRYFPTKEALVRAALEHRDTLFMARMRAALEARPLPERPAAYVEFVLAWTQEPDFHGCAFINAAAEYPAASDEAHAVAAAHKQAIRAYLERICSEAALADPQAAARQLFLLGEGLTVAAQVAGYDEGLAETARAMAVALGPG